MLVPMVVWVTSTSGTAPLTVTWSDSAPTGNVYASVTAWPTASLIPVRVCVWKPGSSALIV